MHRYYVYILSSHTGTLYTGMTNDLIRRVYQHQQKLIDSFTKKYNITRLIYYEETDDVNAAIFREKQI
jgi:putative endonuclease